LSATLTNRSESQGETVPRIRVVHMQLEGEWCVYA